MDSDLLIVTRPLAADFMMEGEERVVSISVVGQTEFIAQALPQLVRRGKSLQAALNTGRVIVFDDVRTIRRIGEAQAEDFGVVHRLLEAIARRMLIIFGFDDGNGEVGGVTEDVIGAFARLAGMAFTGGDDPAIG